MKKTCFIGFMCLLICISLTGCRFGLRAPEKESGSENDTMQIKEPETTYMNYSFEEAETEAEDAVDSDGYKQAYIDILQANKSYIDGYTWQKGYTASDYTLPDPVNRQVVIQDIYGDETPELIFVMQPPDKYYGADLHIFTYAYGAAEELYTSSWDYQVAAGTRYYLFQIQGDRSLYAYESNSDDFWRKTYSVFSSEGTMTKTELSMRYEEQSYETGAMMVECTRNGMPVSEAEFDAYEQELQMKTNRILMYSAGCGDFALGFVGLSGCSAMTCDEAIAYLQGGRNVQTQAPETEAAPVQTSSADIYMEPANVMTGTGLTDEIKNAYLLELQNNRQPIYDGSQYGRITKTGGTFQYSEHSVSFYDITGDGVPEMFYIYSDGSGSSYCRIVTYMGGHLVYLKNNEGSDIWAGGAANGNAAIVFTVYGDNCLYVKTGTMSGMYQYDCIAEYQVMGTTLQLMKDYYIEKCINTAGQEEYIYQINSVDVPQYEVVSAFDRIVQDVDGVQIGYLDFYEYGTDKDFLDKSISMSYDAALAYLQTNGGYVTW